MTKSTAAAHGHRRRLHWTLLLTFGVGLLAAGAVTAGTSPRDLTFAAVVGPTQSLMSIPAPFFGALATSRLKRPVGTAPGMSGLGQAVASAIAIGLSGSRSAPPPSPSGPPPPRTDGGTT